MEIVVAADAAEITVAAIGAAAVAAQPERAVDAETLPVQVVAVVAARLAQVVAVAAAAIPREQAVAAMAAARTISIAESAARTGKATMRAGV